MLFTKEENRTLHESNFSDEAIHILEHRFSGIANNISNKDLDLAVVRIQKEMLEMKIEIQREISDNNSKLQKEMLEMKIEIQKEISDNHSKLQKEMLEMRNEFNLKFKEIEERIVNSELKLELKISKSETMVVWKILGVMIGLLSPFYYQLILQIYKH